jgi:hypothetical protein
VLLVGVALAGLSGCGKPPPANITERLWVSELPTSPKKDIAGFVISEVKGKKLGVFYRGSVYRGAHDMFRWTGEKQGKGRMELLQDGSVYRIRTEPCEPSKGFDHCILMHGDPTGKVRYQSRKRWAVKKKGAESLDFDVVVSDLADEDEELSAFSAGATFDEG